MSLDDKILVSSTGEPDSQFLHGTKIQYAWDSVSLTAFLSCPRRYKYTVIDGLVPKAPSYAIALEFGILFHSAVEYYHRRKAEGFDHQFSVNQTMGWLVNDPAFVALPTDDEIDEMKDATDEDDDGITLRNSKVRTRYHLARAVVWYLDHYATDPLKTFILPSGKPAVELSFRLPLPIEVAGNPMLLCGHIDRAVEFNGSLWASDYKTTKSLTRQFFDTFELSHQMTGYAVAGKAILEQPVKGVWIDGIALQVRGVKLARAPTTRSAGQVKEYFELLTDVAERAERAYDTDHYPMNTASCYFCEFKTICKQPPEFRDKHINMHYERKPGWNPLRNR